MVSQLFVKLPKISLHNHLEGAIRPETFFSIARQKGINLPADTLEDLLPYIQVTGEEQNLVDFLAKIDRVTDITQTEDVLARVVEEIVEDAAKQNIRYLELRGGPLVHVREGLRPEQVLEAILWGLKVGEQKYGVKARFIVCALRSDAPEDNLNLAKIAAEYKKQGVVGFDLAGDEAGYPAKLHQQAFRLAKEKGLKITVHAGEAAGPESVRSAIMDLGAERIGHGIRSIEDPSLIKLIIERDIALEVCPTSNVHTRAVSSLEKHPIKKLYELGVPIVIGDDDPQISNISLSGELKLLTERFGFSFRQVCDLQLQAVKYCFLPEEEKEDLLAKMEKELSAFD
ncbi:MAG TPA: adenosine deaminase [Clostridia bacterium]|jgi:adenosine deaminase|nr:adenosine deaminase [Clostridia bacterium]